MHPYEDEQFLREHPEIRDKLAAGGFLPPSDQPPPYSPRRHSFSGSSSSSGGLAVPKMDGRNATSQPGTPGDSNSQQQHRGMFGRLKDKAIGTKEEREAAKRQETLVRLVVGGFVRTMLREGT